MSKFNTDIVKTGYKESIKTADLFRESENVENGVVDLRLDEIRDFGGPYGSHKFRQNEEVIQEIADSIKMTGVLTPIIVRKDPMEEAVYECLAGHTRRQAAALAGCTLIPAIVKECSDEEAELIMAVTNRQREHLLPSEKGWLYRIEYEAMKRQAGRPKNNSAQLGHHLKKEKSIDILTEKSEDSKTQIQRLMQLTHLIEPLLAQVDRKKIPVTPAVEISYLSKREQEHVRSMLFAEKIKLNHKMAIELKMASKEKEEGEELTLKEIASIMNEQEKESDKKKKQETKYEVKETLFPENCIKGKDRKEYIEAALQYILENDIYLPAKER